MTALVAERSVEAAPPRFPPGRRAVLPALLPGLLMLVIGAVGATRPVLSWDEVATADVARRSLAEIVRLAGHIDAVLTPYYLLLHGWVGVAGTSEAALRAPSILAMAGAAALTGELGRRLFGPLTGGLAGLLFCLLPNASRYAAEARPYAFTCLFAVLALLALHAALHAALHPNGERPGARRWAGYAAAVLLLGLSHVVALATLAAHAYAAARRRDRGLAVRWAVAAAAGLLPLVPLLLLGTGQRGAQLFWVAPLSPTVLHAGPAEIAGAPEVAWLLAGAALFAPWRRGPVRELAVLALAPPAAVALVSLVAEPLWVPRYLLVVLPPLALLAAAGLTTAGRRLPAALAVGAVAVAALPAQREVRGVAAKNGADYRAAARVVAAEARPGDAILFQDRQRALRAGVDYYTRGDPDRPRDVLVRRTPGQAGLLAAEEYRDVAPRLAGVSRVWLVVGGTGADPAARKPGARRVLATEYARVGLREVRGATVALYQRRG